MWSTTVAADQAGQYGLELLARASSKLTDKEKFSLIRATSVAVAGIRAHGRARTSKSELEKMMLGFYLDRVVLDLKTHQNGIAEKLTFDIMKQRVLGDPKEMKGKKLAAFELASKKAAKKHEVPPDADEFSGLSCAELFLEIKYEANNTFNPLWVKLLNQNGDMPSGVQLSDILDQLREKAFEIKDEKRRAFLVVGRKRTADRMAVKAVKGPLSETV